MSAGVAGRPLVGGDLSMVVPARSSGDGLGGNAMRSRHPGGAQAVYADGRVQFLTNSIDKFIYRAQLTIQGRESAQAP